MARPKKQYFGEDKTSNTTATVKKNLKALTKIAAGETVDEAVNVATPKKRRTRSPNKAKGVALESVQVTIPVALTFQVGQLVGQYLTQQMQKQA